MRKQDHLYNPFQPYQLHPKEKVDSLHHFLPSFAGSYRALNRYMFDDVLEFQLHLEHLQGRFAHIFYSWPALSIRLRMSSRHQEDPSSKVQIPLFSQLYCVRLKILKFDLLYPVSQSDRNPKPSVPVANPYEFLF